MRIAKKLFFLQFSRTNLLKDNQMLLYVLRSRGWITSCFISAIRLLKMMLKSGDWFEEQKPCDQEGADPTKCYSRYNGDLLDPVADWARWI